MSLGNPVELGHAAVLAGLFALVTLGARVAQASLGTAGLLGVGLVGGLVDVDSVAVAAASLERALGSTASAGCTAEEARRKSLLVSGRASERSALRLVEESADRRGWR